MVSFIFDICWNSGSFVNRVVFPSVVYLTFVCFSLFVMVLPYNVFDGGFVQCHFVCAFIHFLTYAGTADHL